MNTPRTLRTVQLSLAAAALVCVAGCATDTGNPSADRRGRVTNAIGQEVFNAVLRFGLNQGSALLTGQNGQDAAKGAFQAAAGLVSSDSVRRVIAAYAGPEVAAVAQAAYDKAAPASQPERAYIVNTIGAALQQAANQLPQP